VTRGSDAEKLALARTAILLAETAIQRSPIVNAPPMWYNIFSQRRRWFASTKSKLNSIINFGADLGAVFGRSGEICDLRI
jgi:hypothetical protein